MSNVIKEKTTPAIFLAATASNKGKTTITAALARLLKRQGKTVRVFKTGPDYLDPQILAQASGAPVVQLDQWMAGNDYCQNELYLAACEADLIIVEGAMGVFDGTPSSADLAAQFGIPIALVMDVKGMAQTAGAIALGLTKYRQDVKFAGLIANRCSTNRHRELIVESLNNELPLLATLAKDESIALPERHLGLVQASEVEQELEVCFEKGADWLEQAGFADFIEHIEPVAFQPAQIDTHDIIEQKPLANKTIAIAKDEAFSFIYDINVLTLQQLGAKIEYFSPIRDQHLPQADALWLPGGYPELHTQALANNKSLLADVHQFYQQNKPILAECGGFLYCLDTLFDMDGIEFKLSGLIKGIGRMNGKRGCQGMQTAIFPEGEIRGHAHHRSRADVEQTPFSYGKRQRHPANGEEVYVDKGLRASYLHLFFPNNIDAVAKLFGG